VQSFKVLFASEKRRQLVSELRERALGRSAPLLSPFRADFVKYPGAALAVATSMGASLIIHPNTEGVFGACLGSIMIWIAAVDARRFRIPNRAVLLAIALGLLHAGVGELGGLANIAIGLARGAILVLMFAVLRSGYRLVRGREGLGFGDVKLAAAAGIWLDWDTAAISIALASLSGLLFYACHQYLAGRALSATSRVPFGLFFAPAIWLGWLFESMWLGLF
jgi:leader peptidase (prepilin peptidase)/N-methyltransferase